MADLSKQVNTPMGPETEEERKKRLNLQEALSKLSSGDIVDEMNRLSSQPDFQRKSYTPNPKYEDERKKARDTYGENQDRARTGEVLAHLADAFSRVGAAAYGQNTGFDSSKVNFARPASFEGTKDRNLSEYMQRLKEVGGEEELEKEKARELDQGAREDYGRKFDVLQDALRRSQRREDQGKEDARERKELQKRDDLLYREQRKDVTSQGKSLQEREQAANQLTSELLREDLNTKDKDKLAAKLGPIAAKAGIDLGQAMEKAKELKDAQPGFFGKLLGKKPESAESQKSKLFDQLKGDLDTLKKGQKAREKRLRFSTKPMSMDEEEAIRKSAESVGAGGNIEKQAAPTGPAPAPQAGQAPANSGMVDMIAPNGTRGKIPADKVKDAEAKGFKRA